MSTQINNKIAGLPINSQETVIQKTFPMILPSSGSIGNNGALTLTVSLPLTYSSCFMFFPANAIEAGSPSGLYYVVMSSTTTGIIYNNTYTSGDPSDSVPIIPTNFITTGPGAYSQTIATDIPLITYTVLGGTLSEHDGILVTSFSRKVAVGGGNNFIKHVFGGTEIASFDNSSGTQTALNLQTYVQNTESLAKQIAGKLTARGTAIGSLTDLLLDTSLPQDFIVHANIPSGAVDFLCLESFSMVLHRKQGL